MASRDRCRAPAEKLGGRGAEAMLWAQLGISLAATVLLRQAALFVIPAIVGWLVWHRMWHSAAIEPSARRVQRLTTGLALTLTIMAVTIAPWTIRNRRVFNEFVLLNTNAGSVGSTCR